jgi:hypothetical protein
MSPATTYVALLLSALYVTSVKAKLLPTAPGPNETFRAGSNCTVAWVPDPTGTWDNVTISEHVHVQISTSCHLTRLAS